MVWKRGGGQAGEEEWKTIEEGGIQIGFVELWMMRISYGFPLL
jgi:hypothetical protein